MDIQQQIGVDPKWVLVYGVLHYQLTRTKKMIGELHKLHKDLVIGVMLYFIAFMLLLVYLALFRWMDVLPHDGSAFGWILISMLVFPAAYNGSSKKTAEHVIHNEISDTHKACACIGELDDLKSPYLMWGLICGFGGWVLVVLAGYLSRDITGFWIPCLIIMLVLLFVILISSITAHNAAAAAIIRGEQAMEEDRQRTAVYAAQLQQDRILKKEKKAATKLRKARKIRTWDNMKSTSV